VGAYMHNMICKSYNYVLLACLPTWHELYCTRSRSY